MKRLSVAFKAFRFIIASKELSLNIRNKKSEFAFENGCFAKTTEFLKDLHETGNVPKLVLNQYKEILSDYTYRETNS